MDAPSTTPHDAVFKQFLMHAETARDFLDIHLPAELRELCDLDTLHLESGSFIEESLKGHSTDVLYSVQMQGSTGYLHVVIEHQSKPDKKMTFRMMRYAIAAMHRHLEADHDKLPLVVPILFYQGEATPYPLSMCWFDMFYSPELARRVYNNPFPLVDITITPDDEIMQHRRIAILELLQKHIRQRDLMLLLEQLVTLIDEGYTSGSQLVAMQNYMLQRGHTEQADLFYGVLRDRETGGESMMTLAQWFEERGRQEVRQEVIQEVRQEVRQEFALRFLSKGMSREDVAEMANLPLAEVDKLIS
ncbi:Rpn family recombination-promoting nuclease/putative transposase [Escherichia coli]|jgi:recombination-promoting nuclease RpnC|uniref:Rpn family recombination-promoting nuclease/putative transposase n=1 Tax=Escherichia coli TaxID=562 RepID=UPI00038F8192|nr:Rpn family recombination-promoting nuclease/putative transposase [Escherichia coli]HAI7686198.1 Rpn family recombination-promoting nuclease/putative transposase [Escherichia coli O25b:H4-ST131]EFF1099281.1 Rpn family recombination-promoting nuclease/putative transposase [Escherichia coli]EFF3689072.1 Rpn family recombination-promoting nuclease/putative transposase [Escherichia coli]EFF9312604.1 Rpn family recombination-promoting nuclease/putative transposase [Escherichia coli]EFH2541588.1 R